MDKKLKQMLDTQLKNEFYSGYLYLSMAAYCESINFPGFSHWFKIQTKEEFGHAMKFFDFLSDRQEIVVLGAIEQPPSDFTSIEDIFDKTLKHEQNVSMSIQKIYEYAQDVRDSSTAIFLQWFITEQVEEEKQVIQILETIKRIGKSSAIIMLDKELGKRQE